MKSEEFTDHGPEDLYSYEDCNRFIKIIHDCKYFGLHDSKRQMF